MNYAEGCNRYTAYLCLKKSFSIRSIKGLAATFSI